MKHPFQRRVVDPLKDDMTDSPIRLTDIRSRNYFEHPGNGPICLLCGKQLREARVALVHLSTNGYITVGETPNSQGWFPVGNECKKKLPKAFYID